MQTIRRELVGRHVAPNIAGLRRAGDQLPDETLELLVHLSDVVTLVEESCELGPMAAELRPRLLPHVSGNEGMGFEDGEQPLDGRVGLIPDRSEMLQMAGDLAFVPGDQNRFVTAEILVERRTTNARLLSNMRHAHGRQAALGDQCPCSVENCIVHVLPMRLDGFLPELGHHTSIRVELQETPGFDVDTLSR